jgi:16S rRNA (guanine527-N7)-methyltransferase
MNDLLIETLRDAQRFGFFGSRPVEEAARHSYGFVEALGTVPPGARLVDLGSGGGLPGLVLGDAYPTVAITLIDRREKRTDFLRRAILRLGWEHVVVVTGDVATLTGDVRSGAIPAFDLVTARGFGPPETTFGVATELVTPSGRIVISEPPSGDRWDPEMIAAAGFTRTRVGPVSVFTTADD